MTEPRSDASLSLLEGVRVVDLTSTLSGPYGTLVLGDLGAEIVKVEPPAGDPLRDLGPRRHAHMAVGFLNVNRNKRSVVVDLSSETGRRSLKALCRTADVAVHNLRPDTAVRCGADAATLRDGHPELVHCAIRGYGAGPSGHLPAYDDIIQASCGMAALQGRLTGEPHYVANAVVDKVVGLTAALAISAALYRREQSGHGCAIEIPMFETATAFTLAEHLFGHTLVPPEGDPVYPRQASPMRKLYRTTDGWVSVVVYTNEHWSRFLTLVGRPELVDDPRFGSLEARTVHLDEVLGVVAEAMATATTAEWLDRLGGAGIPADRYQSMDEVMVDPRLVDTGFYASVDHPSEGSLRAVPTPVVVDGRRPGPGRPAPRLGQDNPGYAVPGPRARPGAD
jgi:formyl-CoA transferase